MVIRKSIGKNVPLAAILAMNEYVGSVNSTPWNGNNSRCVMLVSIRYTGMGFIDFVLCDFDPLWFWIELIINGKLVTKKAYTECDFGELELLNA